MPPAAATSQNQTASAPDQGVVRLHITPFTPALLKVYLAPSVLPLAQNISYHSVETFPDKGYGYVDLPVMEAQKLKKKLNGSTLKGSKVRIEEAKPEKRKAPREADEADGEKPAKKRAKKEKKERENGVLEGVELPEGRKVKRGWTETPAEKKKAKMERKEKKDKKDKKDKAARKESKYTKEPELLFNAKLTPAAANELLRKDKKPAKKDKKKNAQEVVIHEFERNTKQPSFLKATKVVVEAKPAVEYINGKGWVDEDGNVVEAETGKVRNRRLLELVDPVEPQRSIEKSFSKSPEAESTPKSKSKQPKKSKKMQATPEPSDSEPESEESSVLSSSSEDESGESEPESEAESANKPSASPAPPQMVLTPSSPHESKEVHPLEAIFKKPRPPALLTPGSASSSTPNKGLAPINTSFSFFGNDIDDADVDVSENQPLTPFTQKDLEWRGLRSAAPTPDTAAVGRRFSFDWRKGSQEIDEDDEERGSDIEAGKQLSNNTKANTHLPGLAEEDEEDAVDSDEQDDDSDVDADHAPTSSRNVSAGKDADGGEKDESEFGKWFWENRGDNNRAWKKRRRDTMKSKRLRENRKLTSGRNIA